MVEVIGGRLAHSMDAENLHLLLTS